MPDRERGTVSRNVSRLVCRGCVRIDVTEARTNRCHFLWWWERPVALQMAVILGPEGPSVDLLPSVSVHVLREFWRPVPLRPPALAYGHCAVDRSKQLLDREQSWNA